MNIAIIGAGVSGLTAARLLRHKARVTVFEAAPSPGGLIRCDRVDGSLFHRCGGHVFNTRRADVMEFFQTVFDRESEFVKADRNSVIFMPDGLRVPYPIENHAYLFDDDTLRAVIADVTALKTNTQPPANFSEFLRGRFGDTLCRLYFNPYNEKIWQRSLDDVPLDWLEGKLPMPTPEEIVFNNIRRVAEKQFVHSTFWYERTGGSQFLADRLAEGTDIRLSTPVREIALLGDGSWSVNGHPFDKVVYTGSIHRLPQILKGVDISGYTSALEALACPGTTSVVCAIDPNPYSWIYLPDRRYDAHRIICTGNFSPTNNASPRLTATIEFTGAVSREDIIAQLADIPLHPQYITHCHNGLTYPIQTHTTRAMIADIKSRLAPLGLLLTGRFADWEYYNMDVAMGAAIDTLATL